MFFTSANPCIPHGGSFGESKIDILGLFDPKYIPHTFFIRSKLVLSEVELWMERNHLSFPIVAKPDIGERGDNIEIIYDLNQLHLYSQKLKRSFLLQEYLPSEFEAGVMVIKNIHTGKFEITSIVTKDFLHVLGDGVSTIGELMEKKARARFQLERFQERRDLYTILPLGERLILEPIGNHKRGTTFLNSNHLMTQQLEAHFHEVSSSIEGFSFGRYDVKATSEMEFLAGRGIKIMELNGAFSEPGHIYDPQESLILAWRDLVIHWMRLAEVSGHNAKNGAKATSLSRFIELYGEYKNLNQTRVLV